MKLHAMDITGAFEESGESSEFLQVVEPESDLERDVIAWAIMPHPETVSDDSARRDYAFRYHLGDYIENGLYQLEILARDASQEEHRVEIAVGLAMNAPARTPAGIEGIVPMWFISRKLHLKPREDIPYAGVAYGRLRFPDPECLPQRRLFGATV